MGATGRFTLIVALLLVLGACGDDDLLGDPDSGQVTSPFGDDGATTTQPAPSDGRSLPCEDQTVTGFGLGTPAAGENSEALPLVCFWFDVPEGLESITIELTDMEMDLTLYVGYGFLHNVQFFLDPFWDSRETGTAAEQIVIDQPDPGPYFVNVGPGELNGYSSFTISAESTPQMTTPGGEPMPAYMECRFPATALILGDSADSEILPAETEIQPREYWCFEVPSGSGTVTVTLSRLTESLDLRIWKPGNSRMWSDLSRSGDVRVAEIEDPEAGIYIVEVSPSLSGQGSEYTITVG